ncbi:heavy-metal-associated domain-containing protein [Fusobacterium perfoetens]|uniref:heavy-metal-associated domain-containing protein n=1 Tax=Fusobacterium perfoetens TaxID=852 RepID=UPI001F3E526C|nr:cation transporter [Fusobacterium perfoetens]MCF2626302.1 heavy-metal-associated domain-containing protein [Fusobacterium perfoetens]
MKKILTIEGMMCGHCVAHVEKALKNIDGVEEVKVSLENKTAEVAMNKDITDEVFKNVISEEGYEVVSIK